MQITYLNESGFVLKGASVSVALALNSKQIGDEDLVITPNAGSSVKPSKNQIVLDWPGEYESRGVSVMIIPVGKEKKANVVKLILDDFAIAHLDNLGEVPTETEEEKIGNIDVLFVSVGKNSQLSAKDIQAVIEAIDPKLVVPMNFVAGEEREFAKQLGYGEIEILDVLKLNKKSDLPNDKMDLKVLKAK